MTAHRRRVAARADSPDSARAHAPTRHGVQSTSVSPLDLKAGLAAIAADFDISRFWADFDFSKIAPVLEDLSPLLGITPVPAKAARPAAKKPKKRRKRKHSPEMEEKIRLANAIMEEHLAEMGRERAARARRWIKG